MAGKGVVPRTDQGKTRSRPEGDMMRQTVGELPGDLMQAEVDCLGGGRFTSETRSERYSKTGFGRDRGRRDPHPRWDSDLCVWSRFTVHAILVGKSSVQVPRTGPGVQVEVISTGSRAITGVATSIAAFVGRAQPGPVEAPVPADGLGDLEQQFGGLDAAFPPGYAVSDFILNDRTGAIVVRLFRLGADGLAKVTVENVRLATASSGEWSRSLGARVAPNPSKEKREQLRLGESDEVFDLGGR